MVHWIWCRRKNRTMDFSTTMWALRDFGWRLKWFKRNFKTFLSINEKKIWGQEKKVPIKITKNIKGWIYYYPGKRKQELINTPLLTPNRNVLTSFRVCYNEQCFGSLVSEIYLYTFREIRVNHNLSSLSTCYLLLLIVVISINVINLISDFVFCPGKFQKQET